MAEAIQTVVGGYVRHTCLSRSRRRQVGRPTCYDPWEVTAEDGRVWKVVADSSLNMVPSHLRAEVVSPVLTYDDIPLLQKVVRAVRRIAGAKIDSQRCGIHIPACAAMRRGRQAHRRLRLRRPQARQPRKDRLQAREELIIRALGLRGRRLARYCRPTRDEFIRGIERRRPRTLDQLNRLWYGYMNTNPTHYDDTRYHLTTSSTSACSPCTTG